MCYLVLFGMFLRLELKVFLWDGSSFALLERLGFRWIRAAILLVLSDASPWPTAVSYWYLGFLVTDHVLYLCVEQMFPYVLFRF